MSILRQDIDQIFKESNNQTPPKSTACWKWISNKFKEIASSYVEEVSDSIKIKMGEGTYSIKIDEAEKEFGSIYFSLNEIRSCMDIAAYNLIRAKENYEPYGHGHTVTFTYRA